MDTAQVFVTAGGLGAMAFVAWFFFLAPHRGEAAPTTPAGARPAASQAQGGHSPGAAVGRENQPA